jgi:ABC-2 type transport system permease protein
VSFRRLWSIARKEVLHIMRDRMTFTLVMLAPTLLLFLMAYALAVDIQHVPIAVLDHDRSQISKRFVQQITAGEDLDLYAQASNMQQIEDMLRRDQIKAALVIHPRFAEELRRLQGLPLLIIIDGTEPQSGGFALDHLSWRTEEFLNETLAREFERRGVQAKDIQPIDIRVRTWFNPGLKPKNDIIPGLISMVLGFPALSVALALARERELGTLEQLIATPVGRSELLLGKMIPYIAVGLFNVVLIPGLAMAVFRVPFNGSFLLFFALSAVFLFSILSMGTVVGVFMRTQPAALALSFLVIFFPGFFLTGVFFPIASMPEVMRLEALALPGTHYAIITRGVFLPGVGIEVLWPYVVMMFGLGVVFSGVAALFFRKKLG